MKVTIITRSDKQFEERDYRMAMEVHINDKAVFSVYDGEPEDSNLSRNFNDCYSIHNLMWLAHKAGVDGEPFEFNAIKSDDI